MNVNKEAGVDCGLELSPEEMERINAMSKKKLEPGEVYAFAVRLCDNEIDRDNERFPAATLEELAPLFVGRSGLFDHQWSTRNQAARIYRTEVVRESWMTEAGEPYCYLKGCAYLLRTEGNRELIAAIEGGIKKEVSVGCAVERSVCSICGKERCGHVKGRLYDGQRCHQVLYEPQDAYECSFVAVPAQRAAGVVQRFQGEAPGDVVKRLEAAGEEGLSLTKAQAQALLAQVKQRLGALLPGEAGRGRAQIQCHPPAQPAPGGDGIGGEGPLCGGALPDGPNL